MDKTESVPVLVSATLTQIATHLLGQHWFKRAILGKELWNLIVVAPMHRLAQ